MRFKAIKEQRWMERGRQRSGSNQLDQLLAETEGVFTETAGGVTVGCAGKLYQQDRILPEETTVLCITGNG
jgi:threonine synthase